MSWTDQDPPATDVILLFRLEPGCYIEIDKVDGSYRATVGNLFGSQEIARHENLEALLPRGGQHRGDLIKFPLKCPAPSTTYLLVNTGDHPMTKTITGTLAAKQLAGRLRHYRGERRLGGPEWSREAYQNSLVMWEVWALGPEGRTFIGHVEGTSHAHAMIKARVRFPRETRNILLQKEYLP